VTEVSRVDRFNVSVREVGPFVEQRISVVAGTGIGEAIAHVQLRRAPPSPAVTSKGINRNRGSLDWERQDRNTR
jgi:hypothetical protein